MTGDMTALLSDLLRTTGLGLVVVAGWVWRDVVKEVKSLRKTSEEHGQRIARLEGAHAVELNHGTH